MEHSSQNLSHPRAQRVAWSASLMALLASGLLAVFTPACSGAGVGEALLTIEECREVGGSPFFDPQDERPVEMSCPATLSYLGEFDEPFFGAEGGICCGGPDATGSVAEPAG